MTIKVSSPGRWINDLFPSKPTDRQLQDCFNIWWRVCLMHIPPRDQRYEYERDFGMPKLEPILEHRPFKLDTIVKGGGQQLLLIFPERWLTTQEEYMLVPQIKSHPQVKDAKLTIVDIVTKSPLIVGNFLKDDIRIVKPGDDPDGMGINKATRKAMEKA